MLVRAQAAALRKERGYHTLELSHGHDLLTPPGEDGIVTPNATEERLTGEQGRKS
jgi:hypothetical protein